MQMQLDYSQVHCNAARLILAVFDAQLQYVKKE